LSRHPVGEASGHVVQPCNVHRDSSETQIYIAFASSRTVRSLYVGPLDLVPDALLDRVVKTDAEQPFASPRWIYPHDPITDATRPAPPRLRLLHRSRCKVRFKLEEILFRRPLLNLYLQPNGASAAPSPSRLRLAGHRHRNQEQKRWILQKNPTSLSSGSKMPQVR
jgi:hypothetical protein